ncbi:MAG: hypothetical protein TR69_WS6001000555 [candidate division WS6 bacterium OLB20]|uniref:Uncharacterized protein n=1 Tax=candidate division WS6 bacterium OLB20 TaxID=1617426 RepID=A0A136LY20_9BACT|nr:MAG: hypothetical protein TR69_WS6001000555 [candidate division WS6 bacterium OLB20]
MPYNYDPDLYTEYIVSRLFPKGENWYEARSICFYAEENLNALTAPDVEYSEHLTPELQSRGFIGMFTHPEYGVMAAYCKTSQGTFLIKNPLEDPDSHSGKTNAMRYDIDGHPHLYYHRKGNEWVYGRPLKHSYEQGEEDVEVLDLPEDFPGRKYITPISIRDLTLDGIIVELNNLGFDVPCGASLMDVLRLDLNEAAFSSSRVSQILSRLGDLYSQMYAGV